MASSPYAEKLARYAQTQLCEQLTEVHGFVGEAEREIKSNSVGIPTFLQHVDKAIAALQKIKAALKEQ